MHKILPHNIEYSALKYPKKIAYKYLNKSVSYAELDKKTNQLANFLIQQGVIKGDRIGIYLDRCIENAIAIYGILKAGAAFVPLNPFAPLDRTIALVKDCSIQFVITKDTPIGQLKKIGKLKNTLKGIIGYKDTSFKVNNYSWEEVYSFSNKKDDIKILESDLAYIMYTSGTTGQPKGIMHSHKSGLDYAKFSAELYNMQSNDSIVNHSPLYYDISTFGYFTASLVGATTVIASEAEVKMPVSLSQLIERETITIWYSVPLALIQMINTGLLEKRNLKSLRWVLFGGEVFPINYLNQLIALVPNASYSNVYGPAETNQCAYFNFSHTIYNDALPLGNLWYNNEALIIDDDGKKVPNGKIGELLIYSSTMMMGYWNQPELTKRAFYTQNSDNGKPKVFYRTGDLVKINEDKHLLFYGRKDRQIKLRGYRIELGEIESIMQNIESINEVAVIKSKNNDLIALVAKKSENTEKIIKQVLSKHLPKYAIPEKIIFVDSIPRTEAGKVDYEYLKANY